MKKTYKNPSMEIIEVKMQGSVLIAASGEGSANDAEAPRFVFDEEGLF